jgi:hypothetical protein
MRCRPCVARLTMRQSAGPEARKSEIYIFTKCQNFYLHKGEPPVSFTITAMGSQGSSLTRGGETRHFLCVRRIAATGSIQSG